ncbi:MAG: undecaprenyl-diphosphate phosphatase [Burkholderiales bacterium]|nr:undecaprenyl-diphosphate phosphatase [Burkholderiales bacterium]
MGIVEGATEFLPISSTGHLIVAGSLLGVHDERGKVFEIAIQIGAIFAVVWAYRERFNGAIKGVTRISNAQRFLWNLFVAFLPVAMLGLLLNKYIKAVLFNPYGVAAASIVGALVIFWVERPSKLADRAVNARVRDVDDMSTLDAVKVGLAQCFGLFPGMSRSGATLIGGMLFGLSRNVATEFSFFLGVPTLAAASLYSLWKERTLLSTADIPNFAVGLVVSFIVALIVIRWLIRFVATHSLRVFAWYRIAFGALILAAGALGWVQWPAS